MHPKDEEEKDTPTCQAQGQICHGADAPENGASAGEHESSYFCNVIKAIGEGLLIVDAEGTIIEVNPIAEHILGIRRSAVLGLDFINLTDKTTLSHPLEFIRADGRRMSREETAIARALSNSHRVVGQVMGVRKSDKESVWINVNAAPILTPAGVCQGVVATFFDITTQMRSERYLHESAETLKKAQSISRVGSWEWNLAENTLAFSDELYRIYGLGEKDPVDIILNTIEIIVHYNDNEFISDNHSDEVQRGPNGELIFHSELITGEKRWFEATPPKIKRYRANGAVQIIMGTVQDITDRKKIEREIIRAKSELEEANRQLQESSKRANELASEAEKANIAKSEFLANISHELRTPLNSILVLSHLMEENRAGNLTGKQIEFARTIHTSGSDLLDLINEVLDLSKVEAGKLEIVPETIAIKPLIENLEKTFAPMARKKNLDLHMELDKDAPESIKTDPQRLHQILKNLLSNAIRFTQQGYVMLTVFATSAQSIPREMDSRNTVEFVVRDTGIGIREEKQKIVFEAFRQADGTTSRKYGGTGLGLSISQKLADALGGIVTLESKFGSGSTFTLYLPRVLTTSSTMDSSGISIPRSGGDLAYPGLSGSSSFPASAADPGSAEDIDFHGKSILLIDDDVRSLYTLTNVLENRGFRVDIAHNGPLGIEKLRPKKRGKKKTNRIDLVLMDIMMPKMDGYQAIGEIRKHPTLESLPIIALTAKAMKGDREKCLEAGASDYLTKPVDPQKLFSRIRHWLRETATATEMET